MPSPTRCQMRAMRQRTMRSSNPTRAWGKACRGGNAKLANVVNGKLLALSAHDSRDLAPERSNRRPDTGAQPSARNNCWRGLRVTWGIGQRPTCVRNSPQLPPPIILRARTNVCASVLRVAAAAPVGTTTKGTSATHGWGRGSGRHGLKQSETGAKWQRELATTKCFSKHGKRIVDIIMASMMISRCLCQV